MKYIVCVLFSFVFNYSLLAQTITTFAGGGASYLDGIPATNATMGSIGYIAFDNASNCFFGEYPSKIRKINSSGIISTFAGTSIAGYSGDGGQASNAQLNLPCGIAFDQDGNMFFSDSYNNRIRKINTITSIITTIAGTGIAGFSGDGGLASFAKINLPAGLCFDALGNLFFTDVNNLRIRKIDTNGIITTFAGNGTMSYSGDGGLATAAGLNGIESINFDKDGSLLIATSEKVRKINLLTNVITTIAGNGIVGFSGDGGPATDATIWGAMDIVGSPCGSIYFSELYNNLIRKIDTTGIINTFVGDTIGGFSGDGGLATAARLHNPEALALDVFGNLYIGDNSNHRIRKVTFNDSCNISRLGFSNQTTPNIESITLTPNPAQSKLLLQSNAEITNIVITNMLGQTMLNKECKNEKMELDIENFKQGVYFVLVNNRWRGKFVKE